MKKKAKELTSDIIRIALFIVLDAAIFQEVLAAIRHDVSSINFSDKEPLKDRLINWWKQILKIDYKPIFEFGIKILENLPSSPKIEHALVTICRLAKNIVSSGTFLRHDLMGRIYHKLLLRTTGKYYATYYTSVPAATLLASLVVKLPNDESDWDFADENFLKKLKIIDPACGSGTLLSAIYSAIRNEYLLTSERKDLIWLHRNLLENSIWGLDILDFASHLTLTCLSLHNPKASFSHSNIYTLPIGYFSGKVYLGSLDFLENIGELPMLLGKDLALPYKKIDLDKIEEFFVPIDIKTNFYDIVIMNPPFSRSAKPNLIFGFKKEKIKEMMSNKLKNLGARSTFVLLNGERINLQGIGKAGLGAYFVFVADRLLREGGRVGLVLPRTMLSGVSWEKVRKLLFWNYEIEMIISNFDPGRKEEGVEGWNWSENTDIGEVLIIARKTKLPLEKRNIYYLNIINKPKNSVESTLLAQLVSDKIKELKNDLSSGEFLTLGSEKKINAFLYKFPQEKLFNYNFLFPCLFSHPELNYLILLLNNNLPLIEMNAVIDRVGFDISRIKEAFMMTSKETAYKIVWGHTGKFSSFVLPSSLIGYGAPKKNVISKRLFTLGSARFLLASRPHLNTERIIATISPEKVLATAFWEISFLNSDLEKLYALWFNSTLGFLLYLQSCENSMGQIFKCKKGHIVNMKVIDPNAVDLTQVNSFFEQLKGLSFENFKREFLLASQGKGLRKQIDDFFISLLKLKLDLTFYYKLLVQEPFFQ